jgi:hypothetical protein
MFDLYLRKGKESEVMTVWRDQLRGTKFGRGWSAEKKTPDILAPNVEAQSVVVVEEASRLSLGHLVLKMRAEAILTDSETVGLVSFLGCRLHPPSNVATSQDVQYPTAGVLWKLCSRAEDAKNKAKGDAASTLVSRGARVAALALAGLRCVLAFPFPLALPLPVSLLPPLQTLTVLDLATVDNLLPMLRTASPTPAVDTALETLAVARAGLVYLRRAAAVQRPRPEKISAGVEKIFNAQTSPSPLFSSPLANETTGP